MLGIQSQFNNVLLPEYVDRWVSTGVIALPDPCAPYDGIPANYGITFGPDATNPGHCIAGTGRWPSANGTLADTGNYGSTFGDAFWVWHLANP